MEKGHCNNGNTIQQPRSSAPSLQITADLASSPRQGTIHIPIVSPPNPSPSSSTPPHILPDKLSKTLDRVRVDENVSEVVQGHDVPSKPIKVDIPHTHFLTSAVCLRHPTTLTYEVD